MTIKFKPIMDQNNIEIEVDGVTVRGDHLCVPIGIANVLEDRKLKLRDIVLGCKHIAESRCGISREESLSFVLEGNDLGIGMRYLESRGRKAYFLQDLPDIFALDALTFKWRKMLIAGYKIGSALHGHCVAWKKDKNLNGDPHQEILFDPLEMKPQSYHLNELKYVSKLGFLVI